MLEIVIYTIEYIFMNNCWQCPWMGGRNDWVARRTGARLFFYSLFDDIIKLSMIGPSINYLMIFVKHLNNVVSSWYHSYKSPIHSHRLKV